MVSVMSGAVHQPDQSIGAATRTTRVMPKTTPLPTILREIRGHARYLISWKGRQLAHDLPSGLRVHISTWSDWNVYNGVFVDGEYDRAIALVIELAPLPLRVLDLGAHAGYFTLRFADRWRCAHRERPFHVDCIEGSPRVLSALRRHLIQPAIRSHCTVHPGLVGARHGHGRISRSIHTSINSIIEQPSLTSVVVPFVNVAELVPQQERIALLKCNIEGAELLFLESYPDLLNRVDIAVVELHARLCDAARCRALLCAAGLTCRTLLRAFGPTRTIELFQRPSMTSGNRNSGRDWAAAGWRA